MNSAPLVDALPWSDDYGTNNLNNNRSNNSFLTNRMIVVNDTVETEGRFMLHTLASQFLSSSSLFGGGRGSSSSSSKSSGEGRVLWLACGPTTEKQVCTALKKIGCDVAAAYLRSLSSSSSSGATKSRSTNHGAPDALQIISMTQEIAIELATSGGDDNNNGGLEKESNEKDIPSWDEETYLKHVYKRVKSWLLREQRQQTTTTTRRDLIILDDASTLSTILGESLTFAFIQKLYTLTCSKNSNDACLVVRCSNDVDVERYITTTSESDKSAASTSLSSRHAKGSRDWVGAGTNNEEQVRIEEDAEVLLSKPPWERSLVEMADGIIDVMPLLSGFSREVHGRIVFTERLGGRGWGSSRRSKKSGGALWKRKSVGGGREGGGSLFSTSSVVNYRCSDNGVIAFRLRSGS